MKLQPMHDNVLIKVTPRKSAGGLHLASTPNDEGEVVELGAICGKSERQGLEPGTRVLFDRSKARTCGMDLVDHVLVGEDHIQAMWAEDEEAGVDSN